MTTTDYYKMLEQGRYREAAQYAMARAFGAGTRLGAWAWLKEAHDALLHLYPRERVDKAIMESDYSLYDLAYEQDQSPAGGVSRRGA